MRQHSCTTRSWEGQAINVIERERYDPSLELAFALAEYFGCLVEGLFAPDSTTPE